MNIIANILIKNHLKRRIGCIKKMIITPENRQEISRPEKIDYFLGMALLAAQRSTDAQTKHGCVITTKDYRVLGVGYNGLPRDCNIESFPNMRPDKYDWMTHSEINAVNNCIVRPKDAGKGIAFVTGRCCLPCTLHLWQNHVDEIYQINQCGYFDKTKNDEDDKQKEYLSQAVSGRLKLTYINPDLSWIKNLLTTV